MKIQESIKQKDKLQKTWKWLFYVTIFLLPIQTRYIFNEDVVLEYWRWSVYGIDILVVLLMIMSFFGNQKINSQKTDNKKLFHCCITTLLIIYSFASIIWAPDKLISLYKSLIILEAIALAWIITKTNISRASLSIAFISGVVFQAGVGIWQFVTQEVIGFKWLGIASHVPETLGVSVVEFGDERWLRAYGALPHPNILGGFLVIGILFMLGYVLNEKEIIVSKIWIKRNILVYTSLVVMAVGLFVTFSRSAWLALFVGISVMTVIVVRSKESQKVEYAKAVFVFLISLFLISFLYWPIVNARLTGGSRLEVKSKIERISSIKDGWEIIQNNWVLGVGAGNYTKELKRKYPNQQIHFYQPVHNTWLLILAEHGIIGFGLILFLCFYVFMFLKKKNSEISEASWAVSCSLLIITLFDHYLFSIHAGLLFTGFVIGLIFLDQNTPRARELQNQ